MLEKLVSVAKWAKKHQIKILLAAAIAAGGFSIFAHYTKPSNAERIQREFSPKKIFSNQEEALKYLENHAKKADLESLFVYSVDSGELFDISTRKEETSTAYKNLDLLYLLYEKSSNQFLNIHNHPIKDAESELRTLRGTRDAAITYKREVLPLIHNLERILQRSSLNEDEAARYKQELEKYKKVLEQAEISIPYEKELLPFYDHCISTGDAAGKIFLTLPTSPKDIEEMLKMEKDRIKSVEVLNLPDKQIKYLIFSPYGKSTATCHDLKQSDFSDIVKAYSNFMIDFGRSVIGKPHSQEEAVKILDKCSEKLKNATQGKIEVTFEWYK